LISGSSEGKVAIFDVNFPEGSCRSARDKGKPEPTNDVKVQPSRNLKLRSIPVNSLAVEDNFPFLVVGGGQGRVSVIPHPGKDHTPVIQDGQEPALDQESQGPLEGDRVDGSRYLHSNSNSEGVRRITRIHKLAISPDGSRCIVGGDGKGGTYIEFWAFNRHRKGPIDKDAIQVDEKALMWHEMDTTPSQATITQLPPLSPEDPAPAPAPAPEPELEPAPMELELLPIPGANANPHPVGAPQGGGLFTY